MPIDPTLNELASQQPWLPPAASNFNKQLSSMVGNVGQSALGEIKNINDLIGIAMSTPPGMTSSDLEQQARIAAKLGLDVTMGGLGLGGAGLAEEGALGIMGGGRGFRELAERGGTSDPLFYQDLAKQLEAQGFDRSQILKGTGWYKEKPSGIWNKEIYDNPSTLNLNQIPRNSNYMTQRTKVGTVLNHPDLYNVYPHLKDLPLIFENDPAAIRVGRNASFMHPTPANPHGVLKIFNSHLKPTEEVKSTILHELQHATDIYEGRKLRPTPNLSFKDYTRLIEEARARNTQYRALFPPEELKNPPWETMKRMQYPLNEFDVTLPP